MIVVPKANGKIRILTKLNESVHREKHPLPTVEQTLGQLAGAKVFGKVGANSCFWQIGLTRESSLLKTFITPVGCFFCFRRLPFEISFAPEYFQRCMSQILDGLQGVKCQMDDVIVYDTFRANHVENLRVALHRIADAKMTLNFEKCLFSKQQVPFLGSLIGPEGIMPQPENLRAITQMAEPTSVTEVRRFLGMANQLGNYAP